MGLSWISTIRDDVLGWRRSGEISTGFQRIVEDCRSCFDLLVYCRQGMNTKRSGSELPEGLSSSLTTIGSYDC